MKKLLQHTLLICAALSAGALYAPGICSITPNDYRWWTDKAIHQLVDLSSSAGPNTQESATFLIQEVRANIPSNKFSLKRLYHGLRSTIEDKKGPGICTIPGGNAAVLAIEKIAQKHNLDIELKESDFTPQTVEDPEWWAVYYPGANTYISCLLNKEIPTQVRSCRGLKMIVAQMNPGKGNQSLDQALKCLQKEMKNNQALKTPFNGAQTIIAAAQKLALEHSKKRPVPSLALPALALSPAARAQLPEDNCLYPSSSAAATTGHSETGQSKTLGMGANPQDLSSGPIDVAPEHSTKIPVSPLSLEPIPPSLESGSPLSKYNLLPPSESIRPLLESELQEFQGPEWDYVEGQWKRNLGKLIDAQDKEELLYPAAPAAKRKRTEEWGLQS